MSPACFCWVLLLSTGPPAEKDEPYRAALNAAVHHFARDGDLDCIEAILARHPDLIDAPPPYRPYRKPGAGGDWTPLMEAACGGHPQVAEYLIRRGARVNFADHEGWTPLHRAAAGGDLGMATLLVTHGARVDARSRAIPAWTGVGPSASIGARPRSHPAIPSKTPLDLAIERKQEDVIRYLRSAAK